MVEVIKSAWPFWAGGAGIGLTVLLAYFWQKKALGVTGGFESICAMVLPKGNKKTKTDSSWKIWFVLGIPLGAFVAHWLSTGDFFLYWQMGQFDAMISGDWLVKLFFFFGGGLLIGYGTRMADGCPSGHSIVGISLGSTASVLATILFMVFAFITVQIIYGLVG